MHSHPLFDNYVLMSCDNQLRLFDLATETTIKVFATRHIESGVNTTYLFHFSRDRLE